MSSNQKMLITFGVGLIIGALAVWLWYEKSPGSTLENLMKQASSTEMVAGGNTTSGENTSLLVTGLVGIGGGLTVADQAAGTSVLVSTVDMPLDGWVAVHENTNGVPGNILGAHRYDKGHITDASITLLRGTVAGSAYFAVLYTDNGDRAFDPHVDMPMRTSSGMILASFVAK